METLTRLRPDRDLQCYFFRPSAIAALSNATETSFNVSGSWRQQFDWAVVEWNRDNTFEHPKLRNLPDGDLSALSLSYEETRSNCIQMDSNLFPTVDWPYLRIWAMNGTAEQVYKVSLKDHAVPIEGSYVCPTATFQLTGSLTTDDYIGLTWLEEQYNYQIVSGDSISDAVASLAGIINAFSTTASATASGDTITLTYFGPGATESTSTVGANGNLIGVYGFVAGAGTESWTPEAQHFSGGTSPTKWRVTLDFSSLTDIDDESIPVDKVRKMRWTYAASLQNSFYARSEFEVQVSNWEVTDSAGTYAVSGPGSMRIEESDARFSYSGTWTESIGNFSGGRIRYTQAPGASVTLQYSSLLTHDLYLGSRYAFNGSTIDVSIDGGAAQPINLFIAGEDILCRIKLINLSAGTHSVTIAHTGTASDYFYLDFAELSRPETNLPDFPAIDTMTLATDWDTDHSISLAPERTAWNMLKLGFRGRVNHYVGAMWFYELEAFDHQYASTTVTFSGTPSFSSTTTITINHVGLPSGSATTYSHLVLIGDTPATIAKAFEFLINNGSTAIWASATGGVLTIYSRSMGEDGNTLTVAATPTTGSFTAIFSDSPFTGGQDGYWRTDLSATPRINKAVRDWTSSFIRAVKDESIDIVCAFSTELQHGDGSLTVGIAQRYPDDTPVLLNTPALQTNFSPISLAFWRQVYLDMAKLMDDDGVIPYLQFGEVQWWYFPNVSGMPFYDAFTKSEFLTAFGFPIRVITNNTADPAAFPEEASFLPTLIGNFTDAVMSFVQATYPDARFEVLYPTDVNEGRFNRVINYTSAWTSSALTCLKTESFGYTLGRNMNMAIQTIHFPASAGFAKNKSSHLVGISDSRSSWLKEAEYAQGSRVESVVLFALDQFCLIGYPIPLPTPYRSAKHLG